MPIQLSNFNIVYQKSRIDVLYVGGLEQFKKDLEYGNVQKDSEDDMLLSFAHMNHTDNSPEGFIINRDYTIVGKWESSECEWLLDNGLYFWHKDYQFNNLLYDKYLSNSITMDVLEDFLKRGPLPNNF